MDTIQRVRELMFSKGLCDPLAKLVFQRIEEKAMISSMDIITR